jgi:hypothetical protein
MQWTSNSRTEPSRGFIFTNFETIKSDDFTSVNDLVLPTNQQLHISPVIR